MQRRATSWAAAPAAREKGPWRFAPIQEDAAVILLKNAPGVQFNAAHGLISISVFVLFVVPQCRWLIPLRLRVGDNLCKYTDPGPFMRQKQFRSKTACFGGQFDCVLASGQWTSLKTGQKHCSPLHRYILDWRGNACLRVYRRYYVTGQCIVGKHMLGQAHRFFSPWSLWLPQSSFIHVPYVVSQCAPEGIDIHTRLRSTHAHVRLTACVTVCVLNPEVVSSSPPGGGVVEGGPWLAVRLLLPTQSL